MKEIVTVKVLADLFGLTTQRIQQLAKDGIIQKRAEGKYYLYESVKGYIAYVKESETYATFETDDGEKTAESLKMEKLAVEVKAKKLKMAEAMADVIPIDIVGREWMARMILIRNTMVNSAQRLVDIVDENHSLKRKEVKQLIKDELKRILSDIKPPTDIEKGDFDND